MVHGIVGNVVRVEMHSVYFSEKKRCRGFSPCIRIGTGARLKPACSKEHLGSTPSWGIMMKKNREVWDTNRTMARKPSKSRFYCFGCDSYLVSPGQKCSKCGSRPEQKRDKKL